MCYSVFQFFNSIFDFAVVIAVIHFFVVIRVDIVVIYLSVYDFVVKSIYIFILYHSREETHDILI